MTTYSTSEIGSFVYNMISSIPEGISELLINGFIPEQSLIEVENYTGDDISIAAIPATYQPSIINLSISQVLGQMEAQGMGTKSVKIGELSINKGMVEGTSQNYKQMAYKQLENLPKNSNYYQTYG